MKKLKRRWISTKEVYRYEREERKIIPPLCFYMAVSHFFVAGKEVVDLFQPDEL